MNDYTDPLRVYLGAGGGYQWRRQALDFFAEGQWQSRAVVVAAGRYRRRRAGLRRRLPGDAGGNRHPLRQSVPAHGGGELRYIPALNDPPGNIKALASLLRRHLRGWPPGPRIS
jgi:hypothetical protein